MLSFFSSYIVRDFENAISDDTFYDELRQYSSHNKKDNGELHSSLLALYLSRFKRSRLYFYTDDFPAKEQFVPYFAFQQIGTIGDSVDLLLFLYWVREDFKFDYLRKYLWDLCAEYRRSLKNFCDDIEKNIQDWQVKYRRDKYFQENLKLMKQGYLKHDFKKLHEAIAYFKNNRKKYSEIIKIIDSYPGIDQETELTRKIKMTLDNLSKYKIYKS